MRLNSGVTGSGVVLLDFDGTLARRQGRWSDCLVEALDAVAPGHGLTPGELRPHLRGAYPWHRHEEPHPDLCDPDAWWARMAQVFAAAYVAAGLPADHAGAASVAVREHYCDHRRFALFDDTVEALATLRAGGWTLAVVSNHVPELSAIVAGLGLAPLVDALHSSALTGYEKPHPEAYRIALGPFAPREAWMVGDDPVADVAGAGAVGIRSVLVRRPDVADPAICSVPAVADAAQLVLAST